MARQVNESLVVASGYCQQQNLFVASAEQKFCYTQKRRIKTKYWQNKILFEINYPNDSDFNYQEMMKTENCVCCLSESQELCLLRLLHARIL